ncbi:hypothetical protein B0T14DRAFT_513113 [Immersiella caudata]|uniref:VASt domain-containing protein n=1 Tax=Immersiella caudata TaxID=314043 RepID=A0AA40C834_9PEZI|nr:hypothetical protein B0T14DRAFT_513113 [Immersiella caudata]
MDNSSNGLGKLIPKSLATKRRRKASETASSNDDSTSGKGRNITSHTAESDNDDEGSGLGANDSDHESSSRPTASTHPSQIGHLTTNSPIIRATHRIESLPSESQISSQSRSSTFSGSENSLDSTTPSLRPSQTGLTPPQSLSKQSSVSKLRDVFRSRKSTEKSSSEERSPRTVAADKTVEPVPNATPLDTAPPTAVTPTPKAASSERIRRLSRSQNIEPLKRPPQTPPSAELATPVIVNTPPTPTDPNHPDRAGTSTASPHSNSDASPKGNMINQRRGRASSGAIGPSKLSAVTAAPLTPTPESGSATPNNPATTFFSSMFSAVQNTANTLSNTITNAGIQQGGLKPRPASVREQQGERDQDSVEVESSSEALAGPSMDSKEPAVKTLGMGDLSLSQLGIVEAASNAPSPVAARFNESDTRARSESTPVDSYAAHSDIPSEDFQLARPISLYEPAGSGDRTPPQGSVYEGKPGLHRSGSIRSAIGRRRQRGSSTATGNTVSAAIAAANASFANPVAQSSAPKLTGFAVATKKRNRDFHTLFKSVPDDDYLIEDYSCALQREILAHGRLYVSEGHLCFSSNILGWVTTLVMSFDEIVAVEKRSTALVFKNGLEISTLHAKHIFASFTSRDTTYDLIIKIWKLGHPHLQSSLNGVRLEEPGGDRTEKIETESVTISVAGSQSVSASDEESDDGDDIYDEDEDDDEGPDTTQMTEAPPPEGPVEKAVVARKASGAVAAPMEKQEEGAPANGAADFPGPATHAPTDCGDAATHYDKILGDDVVPAPLGKVYDLLFGPASAAWMSKWLSVDQKCMDIQMEDKRGLTDEVKTRTFSYIKPLNGAIGPKQTKCIVTEQLENADFEKAVNVLCSTQNPDVPNGNIFVVKTKYCLTWAENNSTRIQINCTIEWSGKSWLKGAIERGANDGQTQYAKDLFASLKAAVSSRPRSGVPALNGVKGKKRLRKGKSAQTSNTASDAEGLSKTSTKSNWGMLEPLQPLLSPVIDIIKPVLTGNVVYGLLVGLLVATWFGFGSNRQPTTPYGRDLGYAGYPQRLAAYEEMWRSEESDMWDWIEERTGIDRLGGEPLQVRRKAGVEARTVEDKLREEKMDEREIKEAIRVTEEHLRVLKGVIERGESR